MGRGLGAAGIERAGMAGTVGAGFARWAMATCALASAAGQMSVASEHAVPTDGEWRLTATMPEAVHVDQPFTLRVRLWNSTPEPAEVLIRHHRDYETPLDAHFKSLSQTYYSARVVRGEDKVWAVRGWYTRCPPLRNTYKADGGGHMEFAEPVTLRDYEGVQIDAFEAGPHLMECPFPSSRVPNRTCATSGEPSTDHSGHCKRRFGSTLMLALWITEPYPLRSSARNTWTRGPGTSSAMLPPWGHG